MRSSASKDMSPLNDHHIGSYQKKVMFSTAAGFGLENMDIMFLSFTLSSIIATLGISSTAAGFISSITNLGMLIGGLFFGILADKYGRVRVFTYTIWIFAIATSLMFFAKNIYMIYALRFLAGIGAGGEYGSGMAIIAESFPKRMVARISSISAVGGQVGAILAALLAAVILPHFSWHALYLFGLLPVILIFFIRRHLDESPEFKALQALPQQHVKSGSLKILFATPSQAWQTVALTIMVMVQIAGYFGLMNWLPSIMQNRLGLTTSSSSLWMIATIIGMSFGMMTFGTVMDRFGARRAFTIFLVAAAISVYVLTLATNKWELLGAQVLVGFFSNGMYGGYGAIFGFLYPTEVRATASNAIMNFGRAVGGFSSVLIGFLMDHYTLVIVMGFLSTAYMVSLIVMLSIPKLKNKKV